MKPGDTVWSVAWGDGQMHVRRAVLKSIRDGDCAHDEDGRYLNLKDDGRIGGCYVGICLTREEAIARARTYMERQRAVYAAELATVDGLLAKLNVEATQ